MHKKKQELGRLGSNAKSEEVCLKVKGGREVRSFVGSYLQFLESARKNPGSVLGDPKIPCFWI